MSGKDKKIPLKNYDIIVDFDPMFLKKRTFVDHSSQETFDQHWITFPTVHRLIWFGKRHFTGKKMLTQYPRDFTNVFAQKSASCDIIMKFHTFITNWGINVVRGLTTSIGFVYASTKFEGISSMTDNVTPPSIEFWSNP